MVENGEVDLCQRRSRLTTSISTFELRLRSMTAVWMGISTLKSEIDGGNITLTGDKAIVRSIQDWLGYSVFAKEKRRVG